MTCPHCQSTTARRRKARTSLGYRTFRCASCRRRFNERTGRPFNELQDPTDVVLLAVLWRLRYKLSVFHSTVASTLALHQHRLICWLHDFHDGNASPDGTLRAASEGETVPRTR